MDITAGPRSPAIVQTLAFLRDPYGTFHRADERFGDTWTLRLLGEGPVVLFSDPDAIAEIFRLRPSTLVSANETVRYLLDERSVIFLEGAEHRLHRRLMRGPLEGRSLARYEASILAALDRETSAWTDGAEVPLHRVFQHLTFDALLLGILGVDDAPRWQPLRTELLAFIDEQLTPRMFLAAITLGPWLRRRLARGVERALDRLDCELPPRRFGLLAGRAANLARVERMLRELVAARREQEEPGRDVLSRFLEVEAPGGGPVPDRDIVQELLTLLVAGHDTTSLALSWAVHLLLTHPQVTDRLQSALANAPSVHECPYLDAVITESMRLRPVAPLAPRRATQDVEVGGVRVPAGTRFAANIIGAHYRRATWGDPHAFRPERFLDHAPSPTVFLPFGGGYRLCLGAAFATYEMRLVLATLVADWHLELPGDYHAAASLHGFLVGPAEGLRVRVNRRAERVAGRARRSRQ